MSRPRGALLVGSVPLSSAEEVFRLAGATLGDHLRRIPDGETGDRSGWVAWQGRNFKLPQFELVKPVAGQYPPTPRFRPKAGVDLADIEFGELGYAASALDSFAVFERLKREGAVPPAARFQVSIPTPLAPVAMYVVDEAQAAVEPYYEARMMQELRRIIDAIPHGQLAIQWDVCIEVWMWERWLPAPFDDVEAGIAERVARVSNAVPEEVELGWHLCYGDFQHEHFHQPEDAGALADMAGALSAATARRVDWIHIPVPIDRTDDAFFAPLARLALPPETELHLGLVHMRDGVDGTRARVETALKYVDGFGVACECGMGRRPPERGGTDEGVRRLFETHAAVSEPLA